MAKKNQHVTPYKDEWAVKGAGNNRTCPLYFSGFNELENGEKIEFENSEKSLLYVAMTRAISHLFISGIGVKSNLIGI